MPTCPNCGGKRIDRFCARCGSLTATAPNPFGPTARPLPARPGGGRGFAVALWLVLVLGGGVLLFFVRASSPRSTSADFHRASIKETTSANDSSTTSYGHQLEDQAARAIDLRESRVRALVNRRAEMDADRRKWAGANKAAEELLIALQGAFLRGEETGRWPVRVAGHTWGMLETEGAIFKTRIYLEAADWALRDLDSAIDKADRGITAAQTQLTELRALKQTVPALGNIASLRAHGERIASVASRWSDLPDPTQLGASRSVFEALDLSGYDK